MNFQLHYFILYYGVMEQNDKINILLTICLPKEILELGEDHFEFCGILKTSTKVQLVVLIQLFHIQSTRVFGDAGNPELKET